MSLRIQIHSKECRLPRPHNEHKGAYMLGFVKILLKCRAQNYINITIKQNNRIKNY